MSEGEDLVVPIKPRCCTFIFFEARVRFCAGCAGVVALSEQETSNKYNFRCLTRPQPEAAGTYMLRSALLERTKKKSYSRNNRFIRFYTQLLNYISMIVLLGATLDII